MFYIPDKLFDKLTSTYDNFVELGLDKILSAKNSEVIGILEAKDEQIKFLAHEVARLRDQLVHERDRAEAAIDRLLEMQNIPGVRNADIQRDAAQKDAEEKPFFDPKRREEINKIFADVNGVGEDDGEENPLEKLSNIGGVPV